MADGKKDGLAAALEKVEIGLPALPAHQLPLFASDGAREGEGAAVAGEVEKRGRGRPPGATNKRTEAWVDYLLARYQSPLVVLAEIYARPVAVLAAELGCDKLEAFRMQLSAAEKLAPYVHAKQPVAIQIDPSGVVNLVIQTVAPEAFGDPGDDDDDGGGGLVIDGTVLIEPPAEENDDKTTG